MLKLLDMVTALFRAPVVTSANGAALTVEPEARAPIEAHADLCVICGAEPVFDPRRNQCEDCTFIDLTGP